ncbi:MAG TPA: hypothetical protein VHE56_11980 [Mycobacteriales bacterium]|nr:hypothetical protein [Mycobacteriales bacterium]
MRRWGLLVAPLMVVLLGTSYAIGNAVVSPWGRHFPGGAGEGMHADVGVTRVYSLPLEASHLRLSPHLTRVSAVGDTRGLRVRYVTTTVRTAVLGVGIPLRCTADGLRPAAGTKLSAAPDITELGVLITPLRPGTFHLRGLDLHWRAGIFHGTTFAPLSVTIWAQVAHRNDGCG